MTHLLEQMAAWVKTRRFRTAMNHIASLPTAAERDEARTAYLGALLDYGFFDAARVVADGMENAEIMIDAYFLIADLTSAPDDEKAIRTLIEQGPHAPACRTERYAALYQKTRNPSDLMAARLAAFKIPPGAEKARAWEYLAAVTRREGELRGFCAHLEEVEDAAERAKLFQRLIALVAIMPPRTARRGIDVLKDPAWIIAARRVIGLIDPSRPIAVLH